MPTLAGTAWGTVPVTGKFLTNEQAPQPVVGTVAAYVDRVVTDRTTGVILLPTQAFAIWTLDATGSLPAGAVLPATDDPDIYPQNFNIRLLVTATNAEDLTLYARPVQADASAGINLANLVPNQVVGDSVPTMRDVAGGFVTWLNANTVKGIDGSSIQLASWADATHLRMPDGSTSAIPRTLTDLASPTATYNFGGQTLTNLASPVNTGDAVTKAYVDSRAMGTGNADMAGYRITNVGAPTAANDATTKTYVDTAVTVASNWSAWTTFTPTYLGFSPNVTVSSDVSACPGAIACGYRTRADEVQVSFSWKATSSGTSAVVAGSVIGLDGLPAAACPGWVLRGSYSGSTYGSYESTSNLRVAIASNYPQSSPWTPTAATWIGVSINTPTNIFSSGVITGGSGPSTSASVAVFPTGRVAVACLPYISATAGALEWGQIIFTYAR